jgi:hypothetical protein
MPIARLSGQKVTPHLQLALSRCCAYGPSAPFLGSRLWRVVRCTVGYFVSLSKHEICVGSNSYRYQNKGAKIARQGFEVEFKLGVICEASGAGGTSDFMLYASMNLSMC